MNGVFRWAGRPLDAAENRVMAQRAGKDERRWHDAQPPAAPLMTMLPLTSPMLLRGHPFYTSFVNGDWRQNKEKKEKKKKKKKKRRRRRRRRRKKKTKKVGEEGEEKKEEGEILFCFVACFTSQQHVSISKGRICSDNFKCSHTETKVADPTRHLTQSQ